MRKPEHWWGSDGRTEWRKHFDAIPYWRRLLLCLLSYSAWRKAVALGTAAVHCLHENEEETFDKLVWLADEQWAIVLRLPALSAYVPITFTLYGTPPAP